MSDHNQHLNWNELSPDERLMLRREYGTHLEHQPPDYPMDITVDRFCIWLNERGIHYDP